MVKLTRGWHRGSIVTAVLTLAMAGVACSSGTTPAAPTTTTTASPTEVVKAAADRTFTQGSFRAIGGFEVLAEGERIGFDSDARIDVDANASASTGAFHDFPGMPDGSTFELIQIGTEFWMRGDALAPIEDWLLIDVEDLEGANPQLAGMGSGMNDPRMAANFLAGASDMEEVGTGERHGELMARYEGTVDLAAVAEAAEPDLRAALEAVADQLAMMGVSEMATTVWIDDAGHVREIEYTYTSPTDAVGAFELTMFTVISEIGAAWDIEAPPAGDVVSLDDLRS